MITSDKVFKIPKQKVGKFVVASSDMTSNFNQKNSFESVENFAAKIAKFIANSNKSIGSNVENVIESNLPSTSATKYASTSAQKTLKRKASSDIKTSSNDEKSDEEESIIRSKF